MFKVLPALVGGSMLGLVGVASAAELVTLTDGQMDELTAGTSAQLEVTGVPSTIARAWVTGTNQNNNQVTWDSGGNPQRANQFLSDVHNGYILTRDWWWDGNVRLDAQFTDGSTVSAVYDIPPYNTAQTISFPFPLQFYKIGTIK